MKIIDDYVDLAHRELHNLPDLSDVVCNKSFDCAFNNLTSLKGCPKEVHGHFRFSYNHISSIEGCPRVVHGDFLCENNQSDFSIEDVRRVCNVGGNIFT